MKFHEVLHLLALFVFLDNGSRDGEKFDRASNGKFVTKGYMNNAILYIMQVDRFEKKNH